MAYILEVGFFDMGVAHKGKREFTVFAKEYLTEEEAIDRLSLISKTAMNKDRLRDWASTPEEPRTLLVGDIGGYRITNVQDQRRDY